MTAILTAPTPSRPPGTDDGGCSTTTAVAGLPGRFCLYYQPILDLHSGEIRRAEALVRWKHPEFGLLRPQASLSGTRWADAISGIETWAAAEVCRQSARWSHHGLQVQIALNVSTAFLLQTGFVASLRQELDRSGARAHLVAVDVPVAALATHPQVVERVCRALDAAGIAVVLDGVVGGARLNATAIGAGAWKIELGHRRVGLHPSVVSAVQQAQASGALAIAKAVEDEAQLAQVRSMGFDGVFGHIVCPPLPARSVRSEFRAASAPRRSLFAPLPPAHASAVAP